MNFYSQAGQDRWVYEMLVEPERLTTGTFLDVGCAGKQYSNTLGLEEIGWTGVIMDCRPDALDCPRKAVCICADATKYEWPKAPQLIDYLSLDVDWASRDALVNLPLYTMQFRVLTVEHDLYAYTDKAEGLRKQSDMRSTLTAHGYQLVCANVSCTPGNPFEDWWVSLSLFPRARRFLCADKNWDQIV